MIDEPPIDPLVCPRGHHAVRVYSQRFRCTTCYRHDHYDSWMWDRSELVDLREQAQPPRRDEAIRADGGQDATHHVSSEAVFGDGGIQVDPATVGERTIAEPMLVIESDDGQHLLATEVDLRNSGILEYERPCGLRGLLRPTRWELVAEKRPQIIGVMYDHGAFAPQVARWLECADEPTVVADGGDSHVETNDTHHDP